MTSNNAHYSTCEQEESRLLPWFVAGALAPAESARVQAHLRECALCAADEQRERRVQQIVCSEPAVEYAPQPGIQKLMARIDGVGEEANTVFASAVSASPLPASTRPVYVRWLAAALVLQTIGLGILGATLWQQNSRFEAPRYSTLTSSAPAAHEALQVRVVFAREMTIGELQALLEAIPAVVAQGPSEAGVYTLSLSNRAPPIDEVLGRLRAASGVLFAEPQLALPAQR